MVLTKEILDFCGALPIYNTEIIDGADNGNGTISKLHFQSLGHRLSKLVMLGRRKLKNQRRRQKKLNMIS